MSFHDFLFTFALYFQQMKFLAIILSFYLLMLTAIPCIDVHSDNVKHKTELTQEPQDFPQHSDSDNCSPFCTCNCCATFVVFQAFQVQLNCFPFSEKQYFPVSSIFISDPLASIWQPPKIA